VEKQDKWLLWQKLLKPLTEKASDRLLDCFGVALTAFFGILLHYIIEMPWPVLIALSISLFLTIFFGVKLIKRMIDEARQPLPEKQRADRREARRQATTNKLFQDLIDEGENVEREEYEISVWVDKVECTVRPLFGADAEEFIKLVGGGSTPNLKRERCLAWLKAARIKFWI